MERIAIEAGCLGTQNICKTCENNVVGFVHFLHVHAAVTQLCLVSLLIICQFHHWSEYSSINYPPCSGEKTSSSLKDFFLFSVIYVKGLEIGSVSKPVIAPENCERLLGKEDQII